MFDDKLTQSLSKAYLDMNGLQEVQALNEAANDYESEHKSILKKLHKAHPELGLDKAEHTHKHSGANSETHTYTVHHEQSGSSIHDKLLPDLKTHVQITHTKAGGHLGSGQSQATYGRITHVWNHDNNASEHSTFEKHEDGEIHSHKYENGNRVTTKH